MHHGRWELCRVQSSLYDTTPPCVPWSPGMLIMSRSFASKKKENKQQNKQQKQEKPSSKNSKRKQKGKRKRTEKDRREPKTSWENERIAKLRRQNNLHPAAKMKRVLSAADFWFSEGNLANDAFLREQLLAHNGYIPLTVLLTFPKFQYWTDLPLLYKSFTNPAAKRFKVIVDENLIRDGQAALKCDEADSRERATMVQIRRKAKREGQEELRNKRREIRYHDRFEKLMDVIRPELMKKMNERIAKEREEIMASKRAEYAIQGNSIRGFLERQRNNLSVVAATVGVWEKFENVEEKWDLPDYYKIEDEELDAIVREHIEEHYNDFLWEDDDEDEELDEYENAFIMEPRKIRFSNESLAEKVEASTIDSHDSEAHGTTELLHSTDIKYALVRHRKVSLESVRAIEMADGMKDNIEDNDYVDDDEDMERAIPVEIKTKQKNKKSSNLKDYSTNRKTVLISKPQKLAKFFERFKVDMHKALSLNNGDPNASAVGFDVEYATLELDIRNTLPAMVQIAGPTADSEIGLIWLDKFPDHGRGILADESSRPLIDLLSDASILKVGVGANKDANHLAAWWGITDRSYVGDFIAGTIDLEDEVEEQNESATFKERSLAQLCETVLGCRLPKQKQRLNYRNKQLKRMGMRHPTAHWRIPSGNITKQMKDYAAHDAASGIDIWMKLKGLQQQ